MRRYNLLLTLFLCVFTLGSISFINATQSLTDCKTSDWTAGETYEIQGDLSSEGVCLNVDADNIIINGNGHTIAGNVIIYGYVNITFNNIIINPGSGSGILSKSVTMLYSFIPYITVNDTTVYNGISVSGYGCSMCGMPNGGTLIIDSSTINGDIEANGGTNPGEDATAGNGGKVVVTNSVVGNIYANGGFANFGNGYGGTIFICGSTTGIISASGIPEGTIVKLEECPASLNGLKQLINNFSKADISNNIKNDLIYDADSAINFLNRGKPESAIKVLEQSIAETEKNAGRKIAVKTADMLIGYIKYLIFQINPKFF